MTDAAIEAAAKLVIRKASAIVGHLAKPDEGQHVVYELARLQIAHLVGVEAIHDNAAYKAQEHYDFFLTGLMLEIESAVKEAGSRRG
ncbi:MAG: hypothetical protein MUP21_02745 [Dehalococcoidia bacterium]|nr:hypothetical protein [Dehalococcoidia bacterium]